MARRGPAAAAGQRDRLLPHGRRHPAGRHVPDVAGDRRPRLQRGAVDRGARGPRGRAHRRRDEGARRDGRARDGLRQARPRLRRPLPAPVVGDRLLPAGGARRPRGRARLRRPAVRPRGRRHRRVVHEDGLPAHRAHARDPRRPRGGRLDVGVGDRARRQPPEGPDRPGAQAARARRCGRARRESLSADAEPVAAGRGAHRTRPRRLGGSSSSRCRRTCATTGATWSS